MLSKYPELPIKKRKNSNANRVAIDGRTKDGKERIALIKAYYPSHYVKTGNRHYISKEAANEPIEELLKLAQSEVKTTYELCEEAKARIIQLVREL